MEVGGGGVEGPVPIVQADFPGKKNVPFQMIHN